MEKLWYYSKNYGTMEKTMILYQQLWNFNLLWKELCYYGKKKLLLYSKLEFTLANYSTFLLESIVPNILLKEKLYLGDFRRCMGWVTC